MISVDHALFVHEVFEAIALSIGVAYYRYARHATTGSSFFHGEEFAVAVGCVFGAAIGNKIVFWAECPHLLPLYWDRPSAWLAGQSMVGGLIGGLLGVEITKKLKRITRSTGDAFTFPVLLGLMIGRIGCFLAGLSDGTYGLPTDLPWGVDFGDGISRHPTQLYEVFFAGVLWALLAWLRTRFAVVPGLLFRTFFVAYLAWRLGIDAIKPVPFSYVFGLSGIQMVCIVGLMFFGPRWWNCLSRLKDTQRLGA